MNFKLDTRQAGSVWFEAIGNKGGMKESFVRKLLKSRL